MARKRIKVAVIGGGCAALTAAYELSRPLEPATRRGARDGHFPEYDVTVYQQGWRLGGKGASGRGASGRIEEHGLHLWMGWYENAFRLMRDCYRELNRDQSCRIAEWTDAFKRDSFTGAMEQDSSKAWRCWSAALPEMPGLPGDGWTDSPRWTVAHYLTRAVGLLQTLLTTLASGLDKGKTPEPRSTPDTGSAEARVTAIGALLRLGQLGTLASLIEGVDLLRRLIGEMPPDSGRLLVPFLEALGTNARLQLRAVISVDDEARRLWTIMDLTLATIRGILRYNLVTHPRGFEIIDDHDCREWLLLNGASQESVDSGYLRALYDLGFAYEDGDPDRPRLAAGQALRSMLRAFFTYRGAYFWKMQGGMGDVVFAPLYEVLRRRGVRFEFYHRLDNVRLASDDDGPHIGALEFDVQAKTKSGGAYEPLIDVRGLPCWPNQPLWDQLEDAGRLQAEGRDFENFFDPRREEHRVLQVGRDFDLVVLGIGLGAIPHVCREIVSHDPRWRAMVDHVKTVATQAFQIWLKADMRQLGWTDPPINVSGFVEPFDTWADMTHLASEEGWEERPRAIAYFCNALPDLEPPPARGVVDWIAVNKERVRCNAIRFLERDIGHLWPEATTEDGRFRWNLLVDPGGRENRTPLTGERCFDTQFWIGSVNPSDRYTLSLPGSLIYRISPLDDTYDNLTIAGDWTDCGFNAGCVEAAVMSGLLAAHAISRRPALHDIVGYDHP
jgi:uncharacterized protein with NAD-binding domain and iron-sulfur cluster